MKVMFFDYWTKGLHHFQPVDQALKALGHSTLLFHLGSLRAECAREEILGGIECRDLRSYDTPFVYEILKRERPDVVMTLNARTVFDRAVVMACRHLGIRTVFLSHGVDTFADNPEAGSKTFEKTVNRISFLLPRVGKYAFFILPNYFYSIWRSGGGALGLARGLRTILTFAMNPGRSVQIPPAIEEVLHDRHLMFSNHAVESLCKLGYPRNHVFAVGNPKNDDLLRRLRLGKLLLDQLPPEVQAHVQRQRPYALVLEDSYPESTGMGGWTAEYRNRWLNEMAKGLAARGYALVVKLHPCTILSSIQVDDPRVLIFQNADLNALIRHSAFCIAHTSTTIDNCVLLDKPVVSPTWGLSRATSDYFMVLGVSRSWPSPESAPDLRIDETARARYKEDRITVLEPTATLNVVEHLTATRLKLAD